VENLLSVVVAEKSRESIDTVRIELVSRDGAQLPNFTAGAHIDVHLAAGLVRQYSLCNHPRERHRYVIAVRREPASRGGSAAIHDTIETGRVLSISAPRNHFPLLETASESLLLAGGIGVTPLLSMAERLAELKANFQFHYCGKHLERMAFRQRLLSSSFAPRVQFHLDDGDEAQRLNLSLVLADPREGAHLYVCGPAGFIDNVLTEARRRGWSAEQVHREYFAVQTDMPAGGDLFQIKLASTGQVLPVPEDMRVLDVLQRIGFDIPVSCEQGVCGTCVVGVLEGDLEHRDYVLTEQEHAAGRLFTPCCSRGRGVVVLDL
jgi:vanillate O-demethylase ferredoxin subunit